MNEVGKAKAEVSEIQSMSIGMLVDYCHRQSLHAGWHDSPRDIGTMLMLMVSELSEAMEAARKDLMDDKLPDRKGIEVELADCVIRICDFCGLHGLDLGGAIAEKLVYNRSRVDHTREHRAGQGGKKW